MAYNLGGYEFEDDVPQEVAEAYLQQHFGINVGASSDKDDTSLFRDIGGSLVGGLGSLVELGGTGIGLATGDPENILTKAGGGIRDFARDTIQSEGFRQQREEVEQRLAELGDKALGEQISGTLGELFTNPYYLLNLGVEQAPQLLGGAGAGLAARTAIRSAAKKKFAKEKQIPSLTKEQKQEYNKILNSKKKKGDKLSPEKRAEAYLDSVTKKFDAGDIGNVAAVRTGIGASGALQGADVAKNTYDEIMQLPPETLIEYPEYQELLNQGLSGEEAQKEIATRQARDSFMKAGLLSLGTAGLLPSTLEKGLFKGFGEVSRIKGAGKGAFMEGLQETAEEGGGALITGLNVQDVDPTRNPFENVGVAGTMGGTLGGLFGLGAGAIRGPQTKPTEETAPTETTPTPTPTPTETTPPKKVEKPFDLVKKLRTTKNNKASLQAYAKKNNLSIDDAKKELEAQIEKAKSQPGLFDDTTKTTTSTTIDKEEKRLEETLKKQKAVLSEPSTATTGIKRVAEIMGQDEDKVKEALIEDIKLNEDKLSTIKVYKENKQKASDPDAQSEFATEGQQNVTTEKKADTDTNVETDGQGARTGVAVPTGERTDGQPTTKKTSPGEPRSVTGDAGRRATTVKGRNNTLVKKQNNEPLATEEKDIDIAKLDAELDNDEKASVRGVPTTETKTETKKKAPSARRAITSASKQKAVKITDQGVISTVNNPVSVAPEIKKLSTNIEKSKKAKTKKAVRKDPIKVQDDKELEEELKVVEQLEKETEAKRAKEDAEFLKELQDARRARETEDRLKGVKPNVFGFTPDKARDLFKNYKQVVRSERDEIASIAEKAKGNPKIFIQEFKKYLIKNGDSEKAKYLTILVNGGALDNLEILDVVREETDEKTKAYMKNQKALGVTFYNQKTNKSYIYLSDSNEYNGLTEEAILHELTHAATLKKLALAKKMIEKAKKAGKPVPNNVLVKSYRQMESVLNELRRLIREADSNSRVSTSTAMGSIISRYKENESNMKTAGMLFYDENKFFAENDIQPSAQTKGIINSLTRKFKKGLAKPGEESDTILTESEYVDAVVQMRGKKGTVEEAKKFREKASEDYKALYYNQDNLFIGTPLQNIDELISYGFTNSDFLNFLKRTNIMQKDFLMSKETAGQKRKIKKDQDTGRLTTETEFVDPADKTKKNFFDKSAEALTKADVPIGKDSLFAQLFDAIFDMLGLSRLVKLFSKIREGTYFTPSALQIIGNETSQILALTDKDIDKIVSDFKNDVPVDGEIVLDSLSLNMVQQNTPIHMFNVGGGTINLGGQQNAPAQTPYGIASLVERIFGEQPATVVNKFVQKFANDRVYAKNKEEEITAAGLQRYENTMGENGFNLVFTALTNMNGLAEKEYLQNVKGLSDEAQAILAEIVAIKGSDSETAMKHINAVMTALHDEERRKINRLLFTKLTEENEAKRKAIMDELQDGDTPISPERIDLLKSSLEEIVASDIEAQKYDYDDDRFQVSHLKPDQRNQILRLYEQDTDIKAQIDRLRNVLGKLNGTKETDGVTIELNRAGNYWSEPVDRIKRFYGFQNYVPLKGLPENQDKTDLFNFASRRVSGELQDRVTAMEGRTTESDNVLVRSFVDASQATLRKHKQPVTLAVYNLVKQKRVEGTIKKLSFKERATTDKFDEFKNPEYIFHYAENGDVFLVQVKDKDFRESVRRTYRETNPLVDAVNGLTAKMGQFHTRYNPNFPFLNYIRDLLTNAFIFGAEYGLGAAGNVIKKMTVESITHLPKTMKFARLYNSGRVEEAFDYLKSAKKYFVAGKQDDFLVNLAEYIEQGGRIAYLQGLTTDQKVSQFEQTLPTGGVLGETGVKLSKAGKQLNGAFDIWMDTFELTARSIAYSEAKKQMKAENPNLPKDILKQRATAYTKNLANFEQTGEYGKAIGAFAMFYRPSITGAVRSAEAIMKGKHGSKMAMVLLGAGATTYMMSLALAGDDEQGRNTVRNDDMTRWTRYWRIHLGDDKVFQVPYGFGNGGLLAMGAQLAALMSGNQTNPGKIIENIARIAQDSYFPIPISQISPFENFSAFAADTMTPSFAKPVVQFGMNISGLGYNIYPNTYNRYADAYTTQSATPEAYNALAREIFDAGIADISPSTLYFFANAYMDGPARILATIDGNIRAFSGSKSFDRYDIPLFGSFASKQSNVDGKQFAEAERDLRVYQREIKAAEARGELADYSRKFPDRFKATKLYNTQVNRSLRKLRAAKNKLKRDATLTPKQKEERLEYLDNAINLQKRKILNLLERYDF